MVEPPELEVRVAALETRVHELAERVGRSEQDAAAARVLAGGADRDVPQIRSEIRDLRPAADLSDITGLLNTLIGQQNDS